MFPMLAPAPAPAVNLFIFLFYCDLRTLNIASFKPATVANGNVFLSLGLIETVWMGL